MDEVKYKIERSDTAKAIDRLQQQLENLEKEIRKLKKDFEGDSRNVVVEATVRKLKHERCLGIQNLKISYSDDRGLAPFPNV